MLGEPAEWTAGEEAGYYNPSPENAEAHLQQAVEEGWGFKADTIEELAEHFGLTNLVETVAAYNGFCEAGEDAEFYKKAHFLTPVAQPPFYAFEYVPSAWGTNGGVKVDSCLRAVDAENVANPGSLRGRRRHGLHVHPALLHQPRGLGGQRHRERLGRGRADRGISGVTVVPGVTGQRACR